jgi:hypothetical protein
VAQGWKRERERERERKKIKMAGNGARGSDPRRSEIERENNLALFICYKQFGQSWT